MARPSETELMDTARALLHTQETMAPMWRLANLVTLVIDAGDARGKLQRSLASFRTKVVSGPGRIADRFYRSLSRGSEGTTILTYSYSSTVVKALLGSRDRVRFVQCSEARPGFEGRKVAELLADAGVQIHFFTDAGLLSAKQMPYLVVVGADRVLGNGFINKIGTEVLVEQARKLGRQVVVLADSTKFWPSKLTPVGSSFWNLTRGPDTEIWAEPHKWVQAMNYYFSFTRFNNRLRILTEAGWLTPRQVREKMLKIRISPRLKELIG